MKLTKTLKAKIMFEWEYEASPAHYGTDDLGVMAEIDEGNARDDIYLFLEGCPNEPEIEIKPVG